MRGMKKNVGREREKQRQVERKKEKELLGFPSYKPFKI